MSRQYTKDQKKSAKILYMQGISASEVSKKVGVSYRALQSWARRGKWPNQVCDLCNSNYRGKEGCTVKGDFYDLYFCSDECLLKWEEEDVGSNEK